ncbi:SpaA isopeptide-forming pilin-related protein [Bacillus thuringiensis]|uniref:SpaA isopeptide-forming pilin-related protein n=1 Tax=Bacillus thuringiensis TaxID=1428 RepID=UPI000BFD9BC5|nr:SpaA isopeptide-forming pilin-related protein [Bacillus thuringiensis]PGW40323.1 hypothetical protein COE03_26400 [Bacillus thuringiensis]
MNKTVKYAIRFLAVPFVTGAVRFSTVTPQYVQAASEQTQRNELGTLEITLTAMEWKYDHSEPGGSKYYPGNNLADVEFTIYNKKDNTEYAKKRTDKNGKVSFQLPLNLSFSCKQTLDLLKQTEKSISIMCTICSHYIKKQNPLKNDFSFSKGFNVLAIM